MSADETTSITLHTLDHPLTHDSPLLPSHSLRPSLLDRTLPTKRSRIIAGASIAVILVTTAIVLGVVLSRTAAGGNLWGTSTTSHVGDRIKKTGTGISDITAVTFTDDNPNVIKNNLPPRLEWNENYGYCGETSFIEAGLYYGGFMSMFDTRTLASNGTDQAKSDSQLLIGVNDYWVANQWKLKSESWPGGTNFQSFMSWVKKHVVNGAIVVIGVFENASVFGQSSPDPDYDHIVPVYGWSSKHPLSDSTYYDDDQIYYTDNGLYTPTNDPIYYFNAPLSAFGQSRKNANSPKSGVYSINGYPTKNDPNYAIAITGLQDTNGETVPVRVDTDKNYESPEIKDGSNYRPNAESITLTVTVSGLTANTQYHVYRYSSYKNIPTSNFNKNAAQAAATTTFTATAATYSFTLTVQSSQPAFFRAVPATAS